MPPNVATAGDFGLQGFLNEINVICARHIVPGVVDNVFKNDPLLAYLKANVPETFPGGSAIQENFIYRNLKGGAYTPGQVKPISPPGTVEVDADGSGGGAAAAQTVGGVTSMAQFDISRRQTTQAGTFWPKFYYVNVTEYKEHLQVTHKGPHAIFSLLDTDMANAALTMSAILANAIYQGTLPAARTDQLNGLPEICTDGSAAGADGQTYANYGTLPRGTAASDSAIGAALNGHFIAAPDPLTFLALENAYSMAVIGPEEPNIGVTSNKGMAIIKNTFQPQQRFMDEDLTIGFRGLRHNNAIIMRSQYIPSEDNVADTELGVIKRAAGAGESLYYLNTKYFRLWVTDDPEFAFGFTGFKPAQDNTMVAGQYLFSGNLTCQAPRLQLCLDKIIK